MMSDAAYFGSEILEPIHIPPLGWLDFVTSLDLQRTFGVLAGKGKGALGNTSAYLCALSYDIVALSWDTR